MPGSLIFYILGEGQNIDTHKNILKLMMLLFKRVCCNRWTKEIFSPSRKAHLVVALTCPLAPQVPPRNLTRPRGETVVMFFVVKCVESMGCDKTFRRRGGFVACLVLEYTQEEGTRAGNSCVRSRLLTERLWKRKRREKARNLEWQKNQQGQQV